MCICCCTCVDYVCAYVREKVMFEVYGVENESMSNQYGSFFFVFSHLLTYCISLYDSFYADLSCSHFFMKANFRQITHLFGRILRIQSLIVNVSAFL